MAHRVRLGRMQDGGTPLAIGSHSLGERRNILQKTTPKAFALLPRCDQVIRSPLHQRPGRATSIAASPSASWPTAVLIAATSPGMREESGVTLKRKLRST